MKKCIVLALLPSASIRGALNNLKTEAAAFGSMFHDFFQYFERQWMKREGPDSFSVFGLEARTNN